MRRGDAGGNEVCLVCMEVSGFYYGKDKRDSEGYFH